MKVQVFKNDKIQKDKISKFLESAVFAFLGMWGVSNRDDLNIMVELDLGPEFIGDGDGMGGTAKLADNYYVIFINQREINKISQDGDQELAYMVQALAHECVHVKQYINGELTQDDEYNSFWMGESVEHLDYHELPHEIEAHFYDEEMAMQFMWEQSQPFLQ